MILHFNETTLEVQPNDSSYRYRSLMAKPQLVLKFSLPEYVEIPVGAWCEYMGERYILHSPQNIKKNGVRNIEYTLNMGTLQDNMALYKLRNSVDHRLKFGMTAKPHEFIDEIVANLNERDGANVWSRGTCIDANEKTIEFNHTNVDAALSQVAETFETEWEIVGNVIHLHKVEYYKNDPLPLSYGKGNGFMPGVGRTTPSNELPIKRLYVQGGDRNIDRSKYGSQYLLLPKSQQLVYEGRTYQSDADGYYIERVDKISDAVKEDSLDCSEHYPSRVGTVTSVIAVKPEKNFYEFIDNTIPADLDFNDYIIEGETATIIFQSGMLAGKEFEFKYKHSERRFEIVPQEIDGQTMPNSIYKPNASGTPDTYAIFGIMLHQSYICDNEAKEGASWDMFREAAKHLYENEDQKFTFTGTLQSLYAKRNWVNIGGKLKIGGYIHFSDTQFAQDGIDIRITGIKDFLTSPYAPTVEISNNVSGQSLTSKLREIDAQEVIIEENHKDALQFTRRRFRDAQETLTMLEDAFDNFSGSVNPVTVQTMAMLVGDESLQFQFVTGLSSTTIDTSFQVTYDAATKQLSVPHSFLRHMTLGIDNIKPSHSVNEYKTWEMTAFQSARLDDGSKKYYLYAKVDTAAAQNGVFLLSESVIGMESVSGYYHLLVGVLNAELDEQRSYVSLYGFTEILPARITTDRIVSADGNTFFDLAAGKIGGFIDFQDGLISGLIELGNAQGVNAGLSGEGTENTDIRMWAGATASNKATAPFRVLHDGKLFASDADIKGKITATDGVFKGSISLNAQNISDAENIYLSFDTGFNFAGCSYQRVGVSEGYYIRQNIFLPTDVKYAGVRCVIENTAKVSQDITIDGVSYIARMFLVKTLNNSTFRINTGGGYQEPITQIEVYGMGHIELHAVIVDGALRWVIDNADGLKRCSYLNNILSTWRGMQNAMMSIVGTYELSGDTYNFSPYSVQMDNYLWCTRTGTGVVEFEWGHPIGHSLYFPIVICQGHGYGWCSSKSSTKFTIQTADDSSNNDLSFELIVFNFVSSVD